MSRAIFTFFSLSLLAVGCVPSLEDARFTCQADSECPSGFSCRTTDHLCYRGDGGVVVDAEADDAPTFDTSIDAPGHDAAQPPDANTDAPTGCGPNCIQVIVLNADPNLMTGNVQWMDTNGVMQFIGVPMYGHTSATTDVHNLPVGTHWTVFQFGSLTSTVDLPIPTAGRYVLAIGPSSSTAAMQLLPQPIVGLHTDNYVYINLVDMTDDFNGLVVSGSGRNASTRATATLFNHTTNLMELQFLPSQPGGLSIALGGGSTPPLLAALLDEQISSSEGTYWMVVAGNTREHLGAANGLRFIPGLPSSTALQSSRLVRFVNALSIPVTVCSDMTTVATVQPGTLSLPMIPPSAAEWRLVVHSTPGCSTGTTQAVMVPTAVGRTLVSIAGDAAAAWTAVAITETVPAPFSSDVQTVVIHNGWSASANIATATNVVSLMTSSASFTILPTSVMATSGALTQTFPWNPMARQSWLVLTQLTAGSSRMFEIDSPYDAAWTLTMPSGT